MPITDAEFRELMHYSHKVVSRCDVHRFNGSFIRSLEVLSGFTTVDEDNTIRRRAYITLTDETGELTPNEAYDLLHPLSGNEFRLYRGIEGKLYSQGRFTMSRTTVEDSKERFEIRVDGYDYSRKVQKARFINNYQVTPGQPFGQAMRDMLAFKNPWIKFSFPQSADSFVTGFHVFGGSGETGGGNAWDAATSMAESIGHELFFDKETGECTLRQVPELVGTITDHTYHYHDDDESMLLYVNRTLDDEDTFSRVVVYGENSDNDEAFLATAIDDDPNSPTYIYGPFGDVPTFFRSRFITSTVQAQAVADALLRQKKGVEERLRIIALVDPSHDVGDSIHVERARAKVAALYVLNKFTMPQEASQALHLDTRVRRLTGSLTA